MFWSQNLVTKGIRPHAVRRSGPGLWFAAARPFSYPASVMPVLVGTAAAASVRQWRWGVLAAEIIVVVLIHSFGNLLNDYFDYLSGVDARKLDDLDRPGRFLVHGTLAPRQVLHMALACAIALAPFAAWLIWQGGWPVIGLGLVGVLGAYAYTGKPFALKYHGLGELCIFVVFGAATVAGAAYMQTMRMDPRVLLYAVPVGMLIVAILAANNLRDIEEDWQGGIVTLARLVGRRGYLLVYMILMFGPAAVVAAFALTGLWPMWSLLALCAVPLGITPALWAQRGIRRPNADVMTARYMTIFSFLLFLGLVVAGVRPPG